MVKYNEKKTIKVVFLLEKSNRERNKDMDMQRRHTLFGTNTSLSNIVNEVIKTISSQV